jgi:hypothetical protein
MENKAVEDYAFVIHYLGLERYVGPALQNKTTQKRVKDTLEFFKDTWVHDTLSIDVETHILAEHGYFSVTLK